MNKLARSRAGLRILTPLGWGVLALGVSGLVLAQTLHWHEFVLFGGVALALVALAVGWVLMPGAADCDIVVHPTRVKEGGRQAEARLRVRAGAFPMLAPRLEVPVGTASVTARMPLVPPYQEVSHEVAVPPLRRGVYDVGPVQHAKADPLGLARRLIERGEPQSLHVAPRVTDVAFVSSGRISDLEGATSEQLSMSDLAFHALREYVQGDDLRHVHWRSSAKAGQLLVRQYHESTRGHVTVLLDQARGSYADDEEFELAVSSATSIAMRSVRDGFETYFRCGPHIARGRQQVAMLDVACRFASGDDAYHSTVGDALGEVAGSGLVVQVTGMRRPGRDLQGSLARFGGGVNGVFVRAGGPGTRARWGGTRGAREVVVPDLVSLGPLLEAGLR